MTRDRKPMQPKRAAFSKCPLAQKDWSGRSPSNLIDHRLQRQAHRRVDLPIAKVASGGHNVRPRSQDLGVVYFVLPRCFKPPTRLPVPL